MCTQLLYMYNIYLQCSLHTIFFLCSPFLFVYPSVLCSNVVKKSVNRVWLAKKDNKNQQNKNQFCIYYNRFGKHNLCVDISPSLCLSSYFSLCLYPFLSIFLSVSDTSCICTCTYLQVVVTEVINVHLLMIQNM